MKMTKKAVLSNSTIVITLGYCHPLERIIKLGLERVGHCSGVYGWNCDIYHITPNITVAAGARPFGSQLSEDFRKKWCKKWEVYSQKDFLAQSRCKTRLYNSFIKALILECKEVIPCN